MTHKERDNQRGNELGKQHEVINIILGLKQVAVEPCDTTVFAYIKPLSHKVCVYTPENCPLAHRAQDNLPSANLGDKVVLRRLCILPALKSAYIKAV